MFSGNTPSYPALARDKKRLALRTLLAAEVEHLTRLLLRIAAGGWRYRDFTRAELSGALIEFIACFPVYRSYARPGTGLVHESDASHILHAADEARCDRPDLRPELFEFLTDLLLLKQPGDLEERICGALPAIERRNDGQGRGRHGILLLQPIRRSQ